MSTHGIVTDGDHRTSHPTTWAAGDVARVDGRRIEHWHSAREGGERAALSMLGQPVPAQRSPWVFSEVAGELLDVVGWSPTWDETIVLGDPDSSVFAVAYVADGDIRQLAVVNGAIPIEEARAFVERHPSAADVRELDAAQGTGGRVRKLEPTPASSSTKVTAPSARIVPISRL